MGAREKKLTQKDKGSLGLILQGNESMLHLER